MDDTKDYTITLSSETGEVDGAKPSYSIDIGSFNTASYSGDYVIDGSFSVTNDFNPHSDLWPSEYKIEKMIEEYPALKLQYLKFLEIYNLCKDDYNSRTTDDDIPF